MMQRSWDCAQPDEWLPRNLRLCWGGDGDGGSGGGGGFGGGFGDSGGGFGGGFTGGGDWGSSGSFDASGFNAGGDVTGMGGFAGVPGIDASVPGTTGGGDWGSFGTTSYGGFNAPNPSFADIGMYGATTGGGDWGSAGAYSAAGMGGGPSGGLFGDYGGGGGGGFSGSGPFGGYGGGGGGGYTGGGGGRGDSGGRSSAFGDQSRDTDSTPGYQTSVSGGRDVTPAAPAVTPGTLSNPYGDDTGPEGRGEQDTVGPAPAPEAEPLGTPTPAEPAPAPSESKPAPSESRPAPVETETAPSHFGPESVTSQAGRQALSDLTQSALAPQQDSFDSRFGFDTTAPQGPMGPINEPGWFESLISDIPGVTTPAWAQDIGKSLTDVNTWLAPQNQGAINFLTSGALNPNNWVNAQSPMGMPGHQTYGGPLGGPDVVGDRGTQDTQDTFDSRFAVDPNTDTTPWGSVFEGAPSNQNVDWGSVFEGAVPEAEAPGGRVEAFIPAARETNFDYGPTATAQPAPDAAHPYAETLDTGPAGTPTSPDDASTPGSDPALSGYPAAPGQPGQAQEGGGRSQSQGITLGQLQDAVYGTSGPYITPGGNVYGGHTLADIQAAVYGGSPPGMPTGNQAADLSDETSQPSPQAPPPSLIEQAQPGSRVDATVPAGRPTDFNYGRATTDAPPSPQVQPTGAPPQEAQPGERGEPDHDEEGEPQTTPAPGRPLGAPTTRTQNTPVVSRNVIQEQQGGIRNRPVSEALHSILSQAAEQTGVIVRVGSGGQVATRSRADYRQSGGWTGSIRHNHGNAADVRLEKDGRILNYNNPQDRAVMEAFVREAARLGATGMGAGDRYMGPNTIHVGFGGTNFWRADSPGSLALRQAWREGLQGPANRPPADIPNVRTAQQGRPTAAPMPGRQGGIGSDEAVTAPTQPLMIGLKGKDGAFDEQAFNDHAVKIGYAPVTVNSVQEARSILDAATGRVGLYGFSAGANAANTLLGEKGVRDKVDRVVTVAPFHSQQTQNFKGTNWDNYPDYSSRGIAPAGQGFQIQTRAHTKEAQREAAAGQAPAPSQVAQPQPPTQPEAEIPAARPPPQAPQETRPPADIPTPAPVAPAPFLAPPARGRADPKWQTERANNIFKQATANLNSQSGKAEFEAAAVAGAKLMAAGGIPLAMAQSIITKSAYEGAAKAGYGPTSMGWSAPFGGYKGIIDSGIATALQGYNPAATGLTPQGGRYGPGPVQGPFGFQPDAPAAEAAPAPGKQGSLLDFLNMFNPISTAEARGRGRDTTLQQAIALAREGGNFGGQRGTSVVGNKVFTFYAPGASGPKGTEGPMVGSKGNPLTTLDDVRNGAGFVSLAGHPAQFGQQVFIGDITYTSPVDGKQYTLSNVVGRVDDTGGKFGGRDNPDQNHFDIAVGDFSRGWNDRTAGSFVASNYATAVPGRGIGSDYAADDQGTAVGAQPPAQEAPMRGLAKGGHVAKDEPVTVGEEGPETFVPDEPGTVFPHMPQPGKTGKSVNIDRWPKIPAPDYPGRYGGVEREMLRQTRNAQNAEPGLMDMVDSGQLRLTPNWQRMLNDPSLIALGRSRMDDRREGIDPGAEQYGAFILPPAPAAEPPDPTNPMAQALGYGSIRRPLRLGRQSY